MDSVKINAIEFGKSNVWEAFQYYGFTNYFPVIVILYQFTKLYLQRHQVIKWIIARHVLDL